MPKTLTITFAGTSAFAVPALEQLAQSAHKLQTVYTQPDRPAGRGRHLTASPVKQCAQKLGLTVQQPANFNDAAVISALKKAQPDVLIVCAFGALIKAPILTLPRFGCINIHPSLLPRWRGAAPIERALLAGDSKTGISIMQLDAGMDTGPLYQQVTYHPPKHATAGDLHATLSQKGAQLLLTVLDDLAAGKAKLTPQSNTAICHAAKIDKREALIDWQQPATIINQQIHAFNPRPGAYTYFNGLRLKIWRANAVTKTTDLPPGTISALNRSSIMVATGNGQLCIEQLQLAGGKAISSADFIHAHNTLIANKTQFNHNNEA